MTALAIPPTIVGTAVGPLAAEVDARWLMAYAAALGEDGARWYDTAAPGGPAAHPVFPVCYEWPAALALRERALDRAVSRLGVHLTHHLVIHRAPRAGDVLSVTARIASVQARPAGALVTIRFETVDGDGRPVTTTDHGSLYRGVAVAASEGAAARTAAPGTAARPAAAAAPRPRWEEAVPIAAGAAHVYTECARIWNPIHTDAAFARAAGLPGIVLHGTATLALAVSRVLARDLGGDPGAVAALSVRFSGMVPLPSTVLVRGLERGADRIAFDALGPDGGRVLSEGVVCLAPA